MAGEFGPALPAGDLSAEGGEKFLGRLLGRASQVCMELLLHRLAALGYDDLRLSHLHIFVHLDAGGTRLGVLAERAGLTRQGMSQIARNLRDLGYVTLEADPADRRAGIVRLTPRGSGFVAETGRLGGELSAEWARLLGTEAFAQVAAALSAIIAHAEHALTGPEPQQRHE